MPNTLQTGQEIFEFHDQSEDQLFYLWLKTRDDAAGNELVKRFIPLVHIIAEKIYKTLPKSVLKEEIISLGLIGLYEALKKYEPERDLKFETYASFRVRGSILDGLRKEDWLPRKTREKSKKLENIVARLEQQYLRKVTPEEIAIETGLSIDEVISLLDDSYLSNILSIDDQKHLASDDQELKSYAIRDEKEKTPEESLLYSEEVGELTYAIKQLTEKEQLILSLFYKEELTLTEIGHVLDLSTSRISQIHSKTLKKLRSYLKS